MSTALVAVSLFGQVLVHFWYGYNRYPNPAKHMLASTDDEYQSRVDDEQTVFQATRDLISVLFHRKTVGNSHQAGIKMFGSLLLLLNRVAVIAVMVVVVVTTITGFLGSIFQLAGGASDTRDTDASRQLMCFQVMILAALTNLVVLCAFTLSGFVGCVFGTLAWAILSLIRDLAGGGVLALKILAAVMLLVYEEYYNALLFKKSFADFIRSVAFNVLNDLLGEHDIVEDLHIDNPKAAVDVEPVPAAKSTANSSANSAEV